ncbi:aldehyde:ferredoxin oxidoreductase [Micromonospora pisi]|uniref:Aldehyde:ferredoxin oxidoreductase n=1 Tax=Micromonospora pisi TaxID=589240 RepID=A0A495JRE1_9ACTN|nr:aldehyde ferredoxin oxidoreductase N-terminal domain-containing protein [Micromonospora pisi]RKR91205.1 aldehyde:ferredoxin oxidoreductase [Micromonospora pisi]
MVLIHVELDTGESFPIPEADGFGGPIAVLEALRRLLTGPTEPARAPLALVAGAVAGVAGPGLARCAAIGISPLSGAVAETRAEGPYAAGLRAAGVTGVMLYGRAAEPVCVVIEAGRARLEPAGAVWGQETGAATDALLARYGDGAAVAVIGPAGEHGVRYASIVTCRDHPLPRLGLGAVLGAKNVKAVVCVPGPEPVPVADPGTLDRLARWYAGAVPGNSHCVKVYAGAGLHQEALAMLGPNLGIADPWALHARCLQLGLDPVSLGGTLAAAGVPAADVPAVVERIAAGGDPLGEGAARVAPKTAMTSKGVELPPFDPRVQPNLGLGYAVAPIGPRYDIVEHDLDFDPEEGLPHSYPELRLLGATVPRPRNELDVTRTAQLLRLWSGLDALGVCAFAATPTRPLTLGLVEELVEAVTGERPDVLALGARRLRLQREINHRLGIGLDADTLPDRFFTEPVALGRYAGAVLDRAAFTEAVAELHRQLGFTEFA